MSYIKFLRNSFLCGSNYANEKDETAQVTTALKNKSNQTKSHEIDPTNRSHNTNGNHRKENREDRDILILNFENPWLPRTKKQISRERGERDKRRSVEQRTVPGRPKRPPGTRPTGNQNRPLLHNHNRDQNNIRQQRNNQNKNNMPNPPHEKRPARVATKEFPAKESRHNSPHKIAADNQIERINRVSDRQNEKRETISTDNNDKSQISPKEKKKRDHINHYQLQHAVSLIDISQSSPEKHIPINQIQTDPMYKKKSVSIGNFETMSTKRILQRTHTHFDCETLIDSPSHLSSDESNGDTRINQHDHSMTRLKPQIKHKKIEIDYIIQGPPGKHILINQIQTDPMYKKKSVSIGDFETTSTKWILQRTRTHFDCETLIDSPSNLSVDESNGDTRSKQHDHSMTRLKPQIKHKKIEIDPKTNIANKQFHIVDDRYSKKERKHFPETHLFNQKRGAIDSQSIYDRTPETILGKVERDITSPKIDRSDPPRLKERIILETSQTMSGRCSYIDNSGNYSMNECVSPQSESLIEIAVDRNKEHLVDKTFDDMGNKNEMTEKQNLSHIDTLINTKSKVRESNKTIQLQSPYTSILELTNNQCRDFSTLINKPEEKDNKLNDFENQKITRSNITHTRSSTVGTRKLFFGDLRSDTSEIITTINKTNENQFLSSFENSIKKRETVEEEEQRKNDIGYNEQISEYIIEKKAIENENKVSYDKFEYKENKNKQSLEKDNLSKTKNKINIKQDISKDDEDKITKKSLFDNSLKNIEIPNNMSLQEFNKSINKPKDINEITANSFENGNHSDNLSLKVKNNDENTNKCINQNFSQYKTENAIIQSSFNRHSPKIVDSIILPEERNQENILPNLFTPEDKNKTEKNVEKIGKSFNSGTSLEEFDREISKIEMPYLKIKDEDTSSDESIISVGEKFVLENPQGFDCSPKIPHKDPKSNSSTNAENQGNVSSDETDISVGEKCGFKNPEGYCFLNSVIQVLRSCKKFNTAILKYHKSSKVANSTEDEKKIIFVINFCKIMNELKEKRKITDQLDQIQKYFQSSREGDDVHKCFMNILTVIHDVSKELKEKSSSTNENIKSIYETFKQDYNGFVFDCFYGEMSHSICCENCGMEFSKKYQLFKCLPVPLPNSSTSIELIRCINSVFESSDIEGENMMSCKCENGNERIVSKSQMTYSPEYLFVYLNRGSYFVGGPKNNTFVTCGKELSLQTVFGKVTYKLISTIDHYGSSEGGHYFCRCSYESDEWWLLNDTQVEYLGDPSIENIITEKTIVFVFRKMKL